MPLANPPPSNPQGPSCCGIYGGLIYTSAYYLLWPCIWMQDFINTSLWNITVGNLCIPSWLQDTGQAVNQTASCWPLTDEARIWFKASICGFCGSQSGNCTGFSPRTSVFQSVILTTPTTHFMHLPLTFTHSLTSWRRVFLEQLTRSQLVKKFSTFMELKGSLPHLQEPTTCPYPEPTTDTI